jgi:hypothetical protein
MKKDTRSSAVARVKAKGGVSWRLMVKGNNFSEVTEKHQKGLIYFIRGLVLDTGGSLHLSDDLWENVLNAH